MLITGGAGFIGTNLWRYFREHFPDLEVVILDDLSLGRYENLNGFTGDFVEGSVTDDALVLETASGCDSIIHLAALGSVPRSVAHPFPTNHVNVLGTLNVLHAGNLEGCRNVILASSSSVYGANPKLPKAETDFTRPLSPYGASKLAAEGYGLAFQSSYDMPVLALRFFNVYGPFQRADHDYAAVIPNFISKSLRQEPVVVHGTGDQTRDFTYVGSVCSVIANAVIEEKSSPSPINLAFGTSTSVGELIQIIEDVVGISVIRNYVDERAGDVFASRADTHYFASLFPDVKPVQLVDGIRETVSWFQEWPEGRE